MTLTNHQKGILLAFIGVMLLTPDSLLIRLITVDTWSLLFYRSLIPELNFYKIKDSKYLQLSVGLINYQELKA